MESVKHPGTILAAVDLVAIITLWVHLQRKINDLSKEIERLDKEDTTIKDGVKKQIDAISMQMSTLINNFNAMGHQFKADHETIINLQNKIESQDKQIQYLTSIVGNSEYNVNMNYNHPRHSHVTRRYVEESESDTEVPQSQHNKNKKITKAKELNNQQMPTIVIPQNHINNSNTNTKTKKDFVERKSTKSNISNSRLINNPNSQYSQYSNNNNANYSNNNPNSQYSNNSNNNNANSQYSGKDNSQYSVNNLDNENDDEEEGEEDDKQDEIDYVTSMAMKKASKNIKNK